MNKCNRCKGEGYITEFKHIQNGICFACNGSGCISEYGDCYDEFECSDESNDGIYVDWLGGSESEFWEH